MDSGSPCRPTVDGRSGYWGRRTTGSDYSQTHTPSNYSLSSGGGCEEQPAKRDTLILTRLVVT
jgi:hypothetical protein